MVGDDLGEGRLVPLPGRLAADEHRRPAVRIEVQRRPLVAVAAAGIDVEGEPDAAQSRPVPRALPLRPGAPPIARLVPAALRAGRLEDGREVAGVVGLAERRAVGHGGGGDQVAAAQRGRAEAQLVRRLVDHALQQVDALRPARAPVGIGRRGVGVGRAHADVERWRGVGADQCAAAADGRDGGPVVRGIGAEIGDVLQLEREEAPVRVERERHAGVEVAGMVVARHGLAAVPHPLDRAAEHAGGEEHERVFGIDPDLDPEGARRRPASPRARSRPAPSARAGRARSAPGGRPVCRR